MRWLQEFLCETEKCGTDKSDKRVQKSLIAKRHIEISPNMAVPPTDKSDKSLEGQLREYGIRIAIDKQTGDVCLIFRDDVERVVQADCATLLSLGDLPENDRHEILTTVTYYESLINRRGL